MLNNYFSDDINRFPFEPTGQFFSSLSNILLDPIREYIGFPYTSNEISFIRYNDLQEKEVMYNSRSSYQINKFFMDASIIEPDE